MQFKDALKLHNEDEVTVKRTGEVVNVINTWTEGKTVYIETETAEDGFTTLTHKEVM